MATAGSLRTTLLLAAASVVLSCGRTPAPATSDPPDRPPPAAAEVPTAAEWGGIGLVESAPIETSLGHSDIPDAHDVWLDLIDGATRRLDIAQFYASNQAGSRLEPVVRAIERAAGRGVSVRFLADAGFAKTYPDTLRRLGQHTGIEVRLIEGARYGSKGVLHAKFFVIDEARAFLGSQNFDWRALEHIQELGLRISDARVSKALARVFELDWKLAAQDPAAAVRPTVAAAASPGPFELVASPRELLPSGVRWDLPRLVKLIDGAERSVRVQLLSYRGDVAELERALVEAGKRGVDVRVLVSHWNTREHSIGDIKALHAMPGVQVAIATIPDWSGGFVPYGRVVHAKYLVVDGERFWVGTSNWGRRYFHGSRNVGVVGSHPELGKALDRFHSTTWTSDYAELVDVDRTYERPRLE